LAGTVGPGTPEPLAAAAKIHDLADWFVDRLRDLPRHLRSSLGERVIELLFDALRAVDDASFSRERDRKCERLREANSLLQSARRITRSLANKAALGPGQYEHASRLLEESGRRVGGALRAASK
jgi:hypothetical protein